MFGRLALEKGKRLVKAAESSDTLPPVQRRWAAKWRRLLPHLLPLHYQLCPLVLLFLSSSPHWRMGWCLTVLGAKSITSERERSQSNALYKCVIQAPLMHIL